MKHAILTIKWGTEFSSEHVNILFRAAKDMSSLDFQFICMTDDPKGLDENIVNLPIPMSGLDAFPKTEGAWPKLCLFHPELAEKLEITVFLDIDTVLTGNIDPFFDDPGETLRMLSCGPRWRNFDPSFEPMGATGVFTYRPSFHTNIFDAFRKDPEAAYNNNDVEQGFVAAHARKKDYYPLEWIQSFKYHLRRQYLMDIFVPPFKPAPETLMVAFHGFPRPNFVADKTCHWARFPRCGLHRPKWLIEYWDKYKDR